MHSMGCFRWFKWFFYARKRNSSQRIGVSINGTAAAVEEPNNPSINVNLTRHLIDKRLVDVASGKTLKIYFLVIDHRKAI